MAVGSINLAVKIKYAGVVKLADTLDLGSNALWCAGSSPVTRTNEEVSIFRDFFILTVQRKTGIHT